MKTFDELSKYLMNGIEAKKQEGADEQALIQWLGDLFTNFDSASRFTVCQMLLRNGYKHLCPEPDVLYHVGFQMGLESGMETLVVYPNRGCLYLHNSGSTIQMKPLSDEEDTFKINPSIDYVYKIIAGLPFKELRCCAAPIQELDVGTMRINFATGQGLLYYDEIIIEKAKESPTGIFYNLASDILKKLVQIQIKKNQQQ